MGGIYTTDRELDYDELYCDECGDSDMPIGEAETAPEAWDLLKNETALNEGDGGYVLSYIVPFVMSFEGGTDVPVDERGYCTLSDNEMKMLLKNLKDGNSGGETDGE